MRRCLILFAKEGTKSKKCSLARTVFTIEARKKQSQTESTLSLIRPYGVPNSFMLCQLSCALRAASSPEYKLHFILKVKSYENLRIELRFVETNSGGGFLFV